MAHARAPPLDTAQLPPLHTALHVAFVKASAEVR